MGILWHTSGGNAYKGLDTEDIDEYKASLRKAYGSLKGIKVYEQLNNEFQPKWLTYLESQLTEKEMSTFGRVE